MTYDIAEISFNDVVSTDYLNDYNFKASQKATLPDDGRLNRNM
jgi:hypothetical protein